MEAMETYDSGYDQDILDIINIIIIICVHSHIRAVLSASQFNTHINYYMYIKQLMYRVCYIVIITFFNACFLLLSFLLHSSISSTLVSCFYWSIIVSRSLHHIALHF